MLGIVVSRADEASVHIGDHLLDLADWTEHHDDSCPDGDGGGTVYRTEGAELREFDPLHLDLEATAAPFLSGEGAVDLLAFASRHSGETGPLLTAHHTGNFGAADHGGVDGGLARACPAAHSRVLAAFEAHAPEEYEVGMECTHHGPSSVGLPSMFVELGSGPEQWEDADAARATAQAILDLRDAPADGERHLLGLGGGHYAPRFTRVARDTDWHVGHVAADWCLDALYERYDADKRRAVLDRAFEQSRADHALLADEVPGDLRETVEALGYRVVTETWVQESDGVHLETVADAESAVGTVADGLRFGQPAQVDSPVAFTVRDLPADLLAECRGIDAPAVEAAVDAAAVAYDTEQAGSQVAGTVAIPDGAAYDRIIDALVGLVREAYDAVTREEEAVVVTERAFDPEKARSLGIPEGPAFGRLASGESVEVDGRHIDADVVRTERTHRFPL